MCLPLEKFEKYGLDNHIIVIYEFFGLDKELARMNGAPNETWIHSWRFC